MSTNPGGELFASYRRLLDDLLAACCHSTFSNPVGLHTFSQDQRFILNTYLDLKVVTLTRSAVGESGLWVEEGVGELYESASE